jgi:uncharacterized protein (TIGR04222 family)
MNIFNWQGPQFLALYVVLFAIAIIAALVIRRQLRAPNDRVDVRYLDLQPMEVALLAEGEEHVARAALASLAQRDLLAVDAQTKKFRAKGQATSDATRFEQRIHAAMGQTGRSFEEVADLTRLWAGSAWARLESLGLLIASAERWKLAAYPAIILGFLLLIGIVKVIVGVSRDRPVGNLVLLCVMTVAAIFFFLGSTPRRSVRGEQALANLRVRNSGLRITVAANPARVAPDDFSLAVALFGATVIQTGPHVSLRIALTPKRTSDSTSSSSSCSSGGGCGGGCGGGGCGGCGG